MEMPIENSSIEQSDPMEYMQDMKFVDINQFLNVSCDANIKSELDLSPPEETALEEPNSCVKCTKYDIQLQRANTKIKSLENEVLNLKMKIERMSNESKLEKAKTLKQSTCEKCRLCYKQLNNQEIDQHLCIEYRKFIQCPYCLKAFVTTKDLLKHIGVHKVPLAADRKSKFYKCQKCFITYSMQVLLDCHRMCHIKGYDSHGIPFDPIFEKLAIIMREELNQSENVKQIIAPNRIHSVAAPTASLAYENLVSNLKNVMQKFFKCGKCQESFETGQELHRHMRIHEPPVPDGVLLKKRKINDGTTNKIPKSASNGVQKKRSDRIVYECYLCKCTYKSLVNMQKHMNLHVDNQNIDFQFCTICRMKVHYTKMDWHVCGEKDDIQCEYCSTRFTGTNKLLEHLDEMHKTDYQRLYECEKCVKHFPMIFLKDSHQSTHANEPEEYLKFAKHLKMQKRTPGRAKGAKHHGPGRVKEHTPGRAKAVRDHTPGKVKGEKDHLCEECGKVFRSVQKLEQHKMSSIHSEPSIECPDCGRKFYRSRHLKRHRQLYHSEDNISMVCDICSKEFRSVDGLQRHKKIHGRTDADRRYSCDLCPQKFFRLDDLRNHKTKHIGVKQFQCDFCDNSYKYKGDLNKHLRTHLDGKIYECTACQMRFKYAVELQKHSFEHYKEEKSKNQNKNEDQTGVRIDE